MRGLSCNTNSIQDSCRLLNSDVSLGNLICSTKNRYYIAQTCISLMREDIWLTKERILPYAGLFLSVIYLCRAYSRLALVCLGFAHPFPIVIIMINLLSMQDADSFITLYFVTNYCKRRTWFKHE